MLAITSSMLYVYHAWNRTLISLGGPSLFYMMAIVPVVGFGLHYLVSGADAMSAELEIWLIYVLASVGAVFLALFIFNLACAPYRLEREKNIRMVSEYEGRLEVADREHVRLRDKNETLSLLSRVESSSEKNSGRKLTELTSRQVDILVDCLSAGRGIVVIQAPQSNAHLRTALERAFHQSGWRVANYAMMGVTSTSHRDVIVRIGNPGIPTAMQKTVLDAFDAAKVSIEIRPGSMPEPLPGWPDADIIIDLPEVI